MVEVHLNGIHCASNAQMIERLMMIKPDYGIQFVHWVYADLPKAGLVLRCINNEMNVVGHMFLGVYCYDQHLYLSEKGCHKYAIAQCPIKKNGQYRPTLCS
jgi:hypothetical protein